MPVTVRRAAGSSMSAVLHRRQVAVGTLHPARGRGRSRSRRRAKIGARRPGTGSAPAIILIVAISACLVSFFALLAQLS